MFQDFYPISEVGSSASFEASLDAADIFWLFPLVSIFLDRIGKMLVKETEKQLKKSREIRSQSPKMHVFEKNRFKPKKTSPKGTLELQLR